MKFEHELNTRAQIQKKPQGNPNRLIFLLLFFLSYGVSAQTYLVDFSAWSNPNNNGAAFVWNSLTSTQTNVMLSDDGGNSSSVNLTHNLLSDNNHNSGWTAGNVGWVHTSAVDGLYSGSNSTVTISGLSNGFFYGIDVVALETAFPSVADITVQGNFADSNRLGTNALGDNWTTDGDGINNWLTWTNVSPSSGSIIINITSVTPGAYSTMSAIRIQTLGPSNTPPTAASFIANVTENQTHTFMAADFGYDDVDADPLVYVVLESVPTVGTLYLDANDNDAFDAGEEVSNGASIADPFLQAGDLQYIQNGAVNTTFQFEVSDGTDTSSGDYLAQIQMTPIPATITSVSVPANDIYANGANLDFTVNFTKAVEVSTFNGVPAIELVIGAINVDATYLSGSGSTALLFRYNIQPGESDNDGIAISSLNLNNGEIYSNVNVAADLTLSNVGNTSLVLVDAIQPQLQSVTRHDPVSSPTDADEVTLRYTFTESVSGVQAGNFGSTHPLVITDVSVTPVSGLIYDVTFGGPALADTNDEIFFTINTAGITDLPGNLMQSNAVIGANQNSYVFENYYFVGGTVSGLLEGNYLVLTNNGVDDETIITNGVYVFDTPLAHGSPYIVVVDLQPDDPIQPCVVNNDDGSIEGADVVNVDITCEVGIDLIYRDGFEQVDVN
ncbi:MAG: hypothetical protein R3E90_11590 [Marinicella sp.]